MYCSNSRELTIKQVNEVLIEEILHGTVLGIKRHIHSLQYLDSNRLQALTNWGKCGDTPAHIAVYKDRLDVLNILLSAGLDPHCRNSRGETVLHEAVRYGRIAMLNSLYYSSEKVTKKKCDLEIKNAENQSLLDILSIEFTNNDLAYMRKYLNWHQDDYDLTPDILSGREECCTFIHKMIGHNKVQRITEIEVSSLRWMIQREELRRICTGMNQNYTITYNNNISYPSKQGVAMVNSEEKSIFERHSSKVVGIMIDVWVDNFVRNAIHLGFSKALENYTDRIQQKR